MRQDKEAVVEETAGRQFKIEPLEERLAPSASMLLYEFQGAGGQGPWVQTGDGFVFLGHDPA